MLGLAILFGLLVWIVVTLIAMRIGYKIAKKKGLFAGFMLTMGGWIVYWAIEFAYIQAKVSYLCEKEAGITVYVTPEQWRKQIGAEWNTLRKYNEIESQSYPVREITIDNKNFIPVSQINKNIIVYSNWERLSQFISKYTGLLIDKTSQKILVKYVSISAGSGTWIAGGSPKFWLNYLSTCSNLEGYEQADIAEQYSNSTLGVTR